MKPGSVLLPLFVALIGAGGTIGVAVYYRQRENSRMMTVQAYQSKEKEYLSKLDADASEKLSVQARLASVSAQLESLQHDDRLIDKKNLDAELQNIRDTYRQTVTVYEDLLKVKEMTDKTQALDQAFAASLTMLSDRNYASAGANLSRLSNDIGKLRSAILAATVIPTTVPVNNSPPAGGYAYQTVQSDIGRYAVSIVSADLSSTRVIVDSASDSDCKNDCPVLPLSDYVSRNGGYAGINGSYFCPSTYPSCQDKKNSFDTLLMNKNKHYLNSDNNVYSVVPAVIFLGSSVRFVAKSLEWGRDTGNDGVLANQPLLLMGGNIQFAGDDDPKKGSKGPRAFVGNKGNTVYIGIVQNATVAEAAHVLKTLGLENALNLDSGGSTALWYNGYKAGPGRNIPNAIVFVRR